MEVLYDLPSGDQVWVIDTASAAKYLGNLLQRFRSGQHEPVFFGDEPRPEGVVISFDQWAEYEELKKEAEFEQRAYQTARERLANSRPEDSISFEEAVRKYGWDDLEEGASGGEAEQSDPPDGRR